VVHHPVLLLPGHDVEVLEVGSLEGVGHGLCRQLLLLQRDPKGGRE
jgi:hypothetical protein